MAVTNKETETKAKSTEKKKKKTSVKSKAKMPVKTKTKTTTKSKGKKVSNSKKEIVATNEKVFDKKKNSLKRFSKKIPKKSQLPTVRTSGGLFGLFSYNVKGDDLNKLTSSIQDKMIEQNKVLVRVIKEFETIYETFNALDQEYIQGILISVKAAEEANKKALKGLQGVQENHQEINQIIEQQVKVINVLQKFKSDMDQIEHLTDVDKIYELSFMLKNSIEIMEEKMISQEQNEAEINKQLKSISSALDEFDANLNNFTHTQTDHYEHFQQLLSDQSNSIIEINNLNFNNQTKIDELSIQFDDYSERLNQLKEVAQDYRESLNERFETVQTEFTTKWNETMKEVSKNKVYFEKGLAEIYENTVEKIVKLTTTFNFEINEVTNKITSYRSLSNKQFEALNEKLVKIATKHDSDIEEVTNDITSYRSLFKKQIDHLTEQVQEELAELRDHDTELKLYMDSQIDLLSKGIHNELTKTVSNISAFISSTEQRLSSQVNFEIEKDREQINELKDFTENLRKQLKLARIISYSSISVMFILVILVIVGVL